MLRSALSPFGWRSRPTAATASSLLLRIVRGCSALFVVAFSSSFLAPRALATEVVFRFAPGGQPLAVTVAGSFNDWNVAGTPLLDPDGDGVWEVALDLPPGRYPYKFVIDGSEWITDGSAPEFEDDGFGGKNSVLLLGDSDLIVDGVRATVASDGRVAPEEVPVRFRFHPEGPARSVSVAGTFNQWSTTESPLQDPDRDGLFETVFRLAPGRYAYKFVVDGTHWFTDETALAFEDDGFGGTNSILEVETLPLVVGQAQTDPEAGLRAADPVVTFRFRPGRRVNAVSVAGSFNGWDAASHPLSDPDGDGLWTVRFRIPPGDHAYQFVIDGETWVSDPHADDLRDDGFGGQDALFSLGHEDRVIGSP